MCLDRALPQDPVAPSPAFAWQNASQDPMVAPSQPRCSPFPDSSLLLDRSRLPRAVGLHILAIEQAPRQQWLMPETPADTTETEIACHYPNQTFSGGQQTC